MKDCEQTALDYLNSQRYPVLINTCIIAIMERCRCSEDEAMVILSNWMVDNKLHTRPQE